MAGLIEGDGYMGDFSFKEMGSKFFSMRVMLQQPIISRNELGMVLFIR